MWYLSGFYIPDNSNIIIDHDIAILPSATAASIDMHVIGMKIIICIVSLSFMQINNKKRKDFLVA